MLRVSTVHDPRLDYYLTDLGDELRRVAPGLLVDASRWLGAGAAPLGLDRTPDRSTVLAVLEGRHPRTGRVLASARRSVVAYDLTFSVPKSVSVLFGLGDRHAAEAVARAHHDAVAAALGYVERRAAALRWSGPDGQVLVGCDGVVAPAVTHCLSRAGDPHLHTHVVVANLAHGVDGRWRALDGRSLFAHAKAAGSLHDAHLRAALSEGLGARWSWRGRSGWELEGSDPVALAALSGRASQIRQELWALGGTSRRARHVAWAATREPKAAGPSGAVLRAEWAARSGWAGIDLAVGHRDADPATLDEHRFAAVIAGAAPSGVCRRDVVAAWATGAGQGVDGHQLQLAVDHWAPATADLGVAEPRRAPALVLPPRAALRALGPRPVGVAGQAEWRAAAAAIDRYRARWGVAFDPSEIGGASLVAFSPARVADHLEVSQLIGEVRVRLGRHHRSALERDGHVLGR